MKSGQMLPLFLEKQNHRWRYSSASQKLSKMAFDIICDNFGKLKTKVYYKIEQVNKIAKVKRSLVYFLNDSLVFPIARSSKICKGRPTLKS